MKITKRNRALIIGVAAMVGMFFWMRDLASWRPVIVGKVSFAPAQLHPSRDGKRWLARNEDGKNAGILNLDTGSLDFNPKRNRNFFEENGLETFPRVSPANVQAEKRTIFGSPLLKDVRWTTPSIENAFRLSRNGHEGFQTAVSKPRGEIYCELFGIIWIWNAKDKS